MTSSAGAVMRIGWVVDVQRDFMEPDGRLYVHDLGDASDPGATSIVATLGDAVAWMRENCTVIVYTGDWHALEDAEIDPHAANPQEGTYPPHCMGRSDDPDERAGAELIAVVRPIDPLVLPMGATGAEAAATAREAIRRGRSVFIQKNRFDVFEGNAATEAFVATLADEAEGQMELVVIGVARDVCVTQAVDGMQERGYRVTAVRDATWGLGLEDEEVTLGRWASRGSVVTLSELTGQPRRPRVP